MPQPIEMPLESNAKSGEPGRIRRLVGPLVFMGSWVAVCFAGAGTLRWQRGWICTVCYLAGMGLIGVLTARLNKGLVSARSDWRRHPMQRFDRVILSIYVPLTYVQVCVAGMDAVHYRWLPLPEWSTYPGILLLAASMGLIAWTLLVNPFAESTVRIQTERGHAVVSAGPYRFVRHPMYAGSIALYPATALILGSGWALVLSAAIAALIALRTAFEDRLLQRELAGYSEFAQRTRYRLVPGIW